MHRYIKPVHSWFLKYRHYLSGVALLLGFTIDSITLTRVDLWFENLVIMSYLLVAAGSIVVFNLAESGVLKGRLFDLVEPIFPVVAQFAFGGLFSAYFIFYSRSASSFSSWLFVIALAALLIGNERFERQYLRFRFQISILFVALLSFTIFSLPTLLGTIGPHIFLLSGAVSIGIISGFLWLLGRVLPRKIGSSRRAITIHIAALLVLFNVLYFAGALPPLPLALKDIGVYHSVERIEGGEYTVSYEPRKWYQMYRSYNTVFHKAPGEVIYVFSAVFAPIRLSITLVHEWQVYDTNTERWKTVSASDFPIYGGRAEGYRGYSFSSAAGGGTWRVNVMTRYGQVIGRVHFKITEVEKQVPLKQKVI